MSREDYLMLSLFLGMVMAGSGVIGWVLNDSWHERRGRVTKPQVRDRIIDLRDSTVTYIEPPEMPEWVRQRETQRQ